MGLVRAGDGSDCDDCPRSFWAMFGRSRGAGRQYCAQGRVGERSFTIFIGAHGAMLTSGKASLNLRFSKFHWWLRAAYARFSASLVVTDPVVISSESMNESNPVNLWTTNVSL